MPSTFDPSRRRVLRSGAIGAATVGLGPLLLAACGGSEPDPAAAPVLVALFSPNRVIAAGRPQRLPFGLVDTEAVTSLPDDAEIGVTIRSGDTVIDTTTARSHVVTHDHPEGNGEVPHEHADLARYFAVRTNLPEPGIYDLDVDLGASVASLAVQAFDPDEIRVLLPGEAMPAITTPTVDDPGSIEVLCTRLPEPCPFHDHSVDQLLGARRPMAVLVATPSLCQTAYCGPVVDTLMELAPDSPGVDLVHLEVYENPESAGWDYTNPEMRVLPALDELGLDFEPSLFLVDSAGVIADRIDNVFDVEELRVALASLS